VTGVSDGLYDFAFCDSESQMLCTNHVALGRKKQQSEVYGTYVFFARLKPYYNTIQLGPRVP